VLGFNIARHVTKEGHRSPFDFIADAYFHKYPMLLAQGPRGGGKTQGFGIQNLLQTVFKPGIQVVHIGGTELQARDGYAYYAGDQTKDGVQGLVRRRPFNEMLASEPMVTKTILKSGSKIEIRTGGSEKSVSGPHPNILVVDELDHITWPVLNTALQMPMTSRGYDAMTLMASSQYHSYGTMQALRSESKKRGIELYEYDILDVMESCGKSYPAECKECPLYTWENPYTGVEEELCAGRGSQAVGHYRFRDVISKFVSTDPETFALQNLLMRGQSQGMVYPQFSRVRHIKPFPPEGASLDKWTAFAGVDLRSRGRVVVIAQAPGTLDNGKRLRWCIDEWSDDAATPSTIRRAAREIRERVIQQWGLHISVFWMERTASDEAKDWVDEGLNGRTVQKERSNVSYGIGYCRDYLRDVSSTTSVYFDKKCHGLITSLADIYHCKRIKDASGNLAYDRDTPDDEGSDFPDAWRYAMVGGSLGAAHLPDHGGDDERGTRSKWVPYGRR